MVPMGLSQLPVVPLCRGGHRDSERSGNLPTIMRPGTNPLLSDPRAGEEPEHGRGLCPQLCPSRVTPCLPIPDQKQLSETFTTCPCFSLCFCHLGLHLYQIKLSFACSKFYFVGTLLQIQLCSMSTLTCRAVVHTEYSEE